MMSLLVFISSTCILLVYILILRDKNKKFYLLSPLSIYIFTWSFVFILYSFGAMFLSLNTYIIIGVFNFLFIISYIFFDYIFFDKNKKNYIKKEYFFYDISYIKKSVLLLFQIFSLIAVLLYIYYTINDNLMALMTYDLSRLRRELVLQTGDIPIYVKFLNQFHYFNSINIIIFYLSYYYNKNLINKIYLIMSLILAFLYGFFLLQRSSSLYTLFILFFTVLLINKFSYFKLIKLGIKIFLFFLLISVLIVSIRTSKTSRVAEFTIYESIYDYVIGNLGGLEVFLNGYKYDADRLDDGEVLITKNGYDYQSFELGTSTFSNILKYINAIGIVNIKINTPSEYIEYPINTNTYTIIRTFMQDFGIAGITVVPIFLGFLSSLIYRFYYYNLSIFGVFMIGYINFNVFLTFISNNFRLKEIVMIFIIIMMLKKIFNIKLNSYIKI